MKKMSSITSKYLAGKRILSIIHFILLIGPLAYFLTKGFIYGETVQKISIGLTSFCVVLLYGLTLLIQETKRAGIRRSILWVTLLGLCLILTEIKVPIIIIATCSLLDELIIQPILNKVKELFTINKEFDKRNG